MGVDLGADTRSNIDGIIKLLNNKDGKDKSIKIIQYTAKLLIDFGSRKSTRATFACTGLQKNLDPLVSNLSTFRKIIRLGNCLTTAREIHKQGWFKAQAIDYIDLYNEIFDDLYLLLKIGVIFGVKDTKRNKHWAHIADREANRAWMAAIVINIYSELYKRRIIQSRKRLNKHTKQDEDALYWSNVSIFKLLCDFAFCWIDFFDTDVDSSIPIITGLLSGVCGYCKTWHKLNG